MLPPYDPSEHSEPRVLPGGVVNTVKRNPYGAFFVQELNKAGRYEYRCLAASGIDDDLLWQATLKGGRKRGCERFSCPIKAKNPENLLHFGGRLRLTGLNKTV